MFSILVLLVSVKYVSGQDLDSTREFHPCLTWQIQGYNFELICRVSDIIYPFYFLDSGGKVAGLCTDEQACQSFHDHGIIEIKLKTNEVHLTIKEIQHDYVNGNWTCVNGKNILQTEISTSKGIASATDLFIRGEVLTLTNKVQITCYSCRQPYRNNVEFLVDDESVDSISFNRETDRCTNGIGVSHPKIFTCDPSGTSFGYTFKIHNTSTGTHFSCDMRFVDSALSSRFKMKTSLYFDGERFYSNGSKTEITKPADPQFIDKQITDDVNNSLASTTSSAQNVESSEKSKDRTLLWVVVIIGTVIVIVGIVVPLCVFVLRHIRKQKKRKPTRETEMSSADMYGTAKNRHQDKIYDLIKHNLECETMEIPEAKRAIIDKNCSKCEQIGEKLVSKATMWCLECVAAFCQICTKSHLSVKSDVRHYCVKMSEIPENYDIPFLCGTHDQSKLDYFCMSHNEVCCNICKIDVHGSCSNVYQLNNILNQFQISKTVAHCKKRIFEALVALNDLKQSYECNIEDIKNYEKQITRDIHNIVGNLSIQDNVNTLNDNKTALILDLKNRTHTIISNIKQTISELDIIKKKIVDEYYVLLYFTIERGSDKQSFLVTKYLDTLLEDSERKLKSNVESRIYISLHFEKHKSDPLKSLGKIYTKDHTQESIGFRHNRRTFEIQATESICTSFELLKSFTLHEKRKMSVSGLTVSVSGFISICDRGKPRIIVSSATGEKQTAVDVKFQPWEIDSIPYSDMIVIICACSDLILFVDAYECLYKNKVKIEGSAKCCITCTHKYILIGGVNKIDVLRHKGSTAQYLQTIQVKFDIMSLSFNENKEMICFCAIGSPSVQRVDLNGRMIPSESEKADIQSSMKCIRVDDKQNIFVLDSTGINVHRQSQAGEDLMILELENPKQFTFNHYYTKLYLLETDMGRPSISIFSMIR